MAQNVNRNRNKNKNLAGLYAVPHEYAYQDGKLRPEVYGYISKNSPYICTPGTANKPPKYKQDMTGTVVPSVLKNRMIAFWNDKDNARRQQCFLVEKSVYEEMVGHKVGSSSKKSTPKKGARK